ADAHVVVEHIVRQSATRAVRLDADAVVRSVERKIEHANLADAAVGLAADGHAVAPVEVIVAHRHIRHAAGTTLNGHVVVPRANEAVRDGNVFGAVAGIYAVRCAPASAAYRSSGPTP